MARKSKNPVNEALERLLEHLPVQPPRAPNQKKENDAVVSRRDERGTPYPGDFPNPASDRTRGCF